MSKEKTILNQLTLILILLIAVLALLVLGMGSWYMPRMMGMMAHWTGFGFGFMFLLPLASLVIIALGAYFLMELAGPIRSTNIGSQKALEILKERYVEGEITREQYIKMKEDLDTIRSSEG